MAAFDGDPLLVGETEVLLEGEAVFVDAALPVAALVEEMEGEVVRVDATEAERLSDGVRVAVSPTDNDCEGEPLLVATPEADTLPVRAGEGLPDGEGAAEPDELDEMLRVAACEEEALLVGAHDVLPERDTEGVGEAVSVADAARVRVSDAVLLRDAELLTVTLAVRECDELGERLIDCAGEVVAVTAPLMLADAVADGEGGGVGDALALAETEGIAAADLLADRDGEAAALPEGVRVPLPLDVAARDSLVEREGVRVTVTAEEAEAEADGAALPLCDCVDAALDAGDFEALRETLNEAAALRLVLLDAEAVRLSLGSAVDEALRERDADGDCERLGEVLALGEAVQRP